MPRTFVNAIANFSIQGGMVSFTLQDQALRTVQGEPKLAPPEDVLDVVMREQDFLAMLGTFQNSVEQYRAHLARQQQGAFDAGRHAQQGPRLGNPPPQGVPSQGMGGPMVQGPAQGAPAGGGMRIRPRED